MWFKSFIKLVNYFKMGDTCQFKLFNNIESDVSYGKIKFCKEWR